MKCFNQVSFRYIFPSPPFLPPPTSRMWVMGICSRSCRMWHTGLLKMFISDGLPQNRTVVAVSGQLLLSCTYFSISLVVAASTFKTLARARPGGSGEGHPGVERHEPPVGAAVPVELPAQGHVGWPLAGGAQEAGQQDDDEAQQPLEPHPRGPVCRGVPGGAGGAPGSGGQGEQRPASGRLTQRRAARSPAGLMATRDGRCLPLPCFPPLLFFLFFFFSCHSPLFSISKQCGDEKPV